MTKYYDKYKKYLDKYLYLKRTEKNEKLHIIYNFNLSHKGLIITITSNKNVDWVLSEQWCTENINDKIIMEKTDRIMKYKISKNIPKFKDDRLYCYPMVREEPLYACFSGIIGLYLAVLEDDFVNFTITFKTNYPLFISGIGKIDINKIEKSKTMTSNLYYLTKQLFVFTKNYIESQNGIVTLTYKSDAFFFIDPNEIVSIVSDFIDKCYDFFDLKKDVKFLINYNGYLIEDSETTGYGGNGNYAGFNYLVTEKERTDELCNKIKIYLLHELYHHFNKSSDYLSNWFSEGFTEFFCRYLSLPQDEFIKECNSFSYTILD